jgi:exodeoxyribonuclease VII large subunit
MAPKPVTVSQLNSYIKRVLQTDPILGSVFVIGEISNLKYHDSGHVYFSLKDAAGKINCFLAASYAGQVDIPLQDGMEIVAAGGISVFERGGYYSLNVREIRLSGEGGLNQAFEQLKKKLLEEGLFDSGRKRPIPGFPQKVALVTSPTGAAVRDILIMPVLVQGPDAPKDIAEGIRLVNERFPETDVMIVGRGGGSLEELAPFNTELVARAVAGSAIPVISAVGHETDVTLADFAADYRAETPTAAAVAAVPDTGELRQNAVFLRGVLDEAMERYVRTQETRLDQSGLPAIRRNLSAAIAHLAYRTEQGRAALEQGLSAGLEDRARRLGAARQALDHLNPMEVLKRGYAAVTGTDGRLITKAASLAPEQGVSIRFADGSADATIDRIRRNPNESQ